MNIKKNLQRALAASMSVFIMCAGVGTAAFSAGAESAGAVTTAQKSDAPKAESKEKTAQKAQYNKKETVYVIADAQGTPEKVIVSNWIQNTGKEKKLTDKTNLKDIEVLKGDNSFTIDENNVCEWDANGGDIYYKGTCSTDLPVGVNISYELDGKAVSPAELAGKSGKLKIKINYINRQYSEETVNGRKEKIYVPFVPMGDNVSLVFPGYRTTVAYRSDRTLQDYFELAGADRMHNQGYKSVCIREPDKEPRWISLGEMKTTTVEPNTEVEFFIKELFVYLGGAVNYIGRYTYNPTWHAIDYISSGGVNTITGSWTQAKVWRGAKPEAISINVATDPILPGDVIEIPKNHYESFKDFTLFMASLLSVISSAFIIYVNYK